MNLFRVVKISGQKSENEKDFSNKNDAKLYRNELNNSEKGTVYKVTYGSDHYRR